MEEVYDGMSEGEIDTLIKRDSMFPKSQVLILVGLVLSLLAFNSCVERAGETVESDSANEEFNNNADKVPASIRVSNSKPYSEYMSNYGEPLFLAHYSGGDFEGWKTYGFFKKGQFVRAVYVLMGKDGQGSDVWIEYDVVFDKYQPRQQWYGKAGSGSSLGILGSMFGGFSFGKSPDHQTWVVTNKCSENGGILLTLIGYSKVPYHIAPGDHVVVDVPDPASESVCYSAVLNRKKSNIYWGNSSTPGSCYGGHQKIVKELYCD